VNESGRTYRIHVLAVSRRTCPDSLTRRRQNVMAPSFLAGCGCVAVQHLPPHFGTIALASANPTST
jgi:hypothetical protein